jgi:hypothetical protein
MRKLLFPLVFAAILAAPSVAAAELKVSMNGGLVTIIADDVPLSSVLAEWARVGQTKVVNGEQIFTKVTLHIVDMPERKALDIVLRSVAGYMAAERSVVMANASAFDRIMILPTSRPPANSGPIMNNAPPMFTPRPAAPPVPEVDDDPPGVAPPGMMPPGMNPQNVPQNVPGMGPQQPQGPLTSPRPGPLPTSPQQPVPFGTPAKPPAPPGGGGGGGL